MARQQSLDGINPKQIPEIEKAALELRSIRTKRQALAKQEEEAQKTLTEVLKANGYKKGKSYLFVDDSAGDEVKLDVLIDQKDPRAYVRKHKDESTEEEDPETT